MDLKNNPNMKTTRIGVDIWWWYMAAVEDIWIWIGGGRRIWISGGIWIQIGDDIWIQSGGG